MVKKLLEKAKVYFSLKFCRPRNYEFMFPQLQDKPEPTPEEINEIRDYINKRKIGNLFHKPVAKRITHSNQRKSKK